LFKRRGEILHLGFRLTILSNGKFDDRGWTGAAITKLNDPERSFSAGGA
jgi:hypothetical protein